MVRTNASSEAASPGDLGTVSVLVQGPEHSHPLGIPKVDKHCWLCNVPVLPVPGDAL